MKFAAWPPVRWFGASSSSVDDAKRRKPCPVGAQVVRLDEVAVARYTWTAKTGAGGARHPLGTKAETRALSTPTSCSSWRGVGEIGRRRAQGGGAASRDGPVPPEGEAI